jgi:type III secretion protein C
MGLFTKSAAAEAGPGDSSTRGVYSDVRLNAVLVRDKVSLFDSYKNIISILDRPADMVQLEAFIVDIQKDQVQNLGINLGLGGSVASNLILQPFNGRNLVASIKAMETNGLAQTLSVPSVVSLNNEQALFSSRQNFFISVAGTGTAPSTVNQVTAETQLLVTPQIANESPDVPFDERRVKLLVNVQDAQANANTTTTKTNLLIAGSETISLPSTTENQITTQAVVRSGDTLVIGGQVIRKKINSSAGLPGAQSTGIFSFLFSEKTSEFHDYVRVYVVRPKILGEDSVSANSITADTSARKIANENTQ